MLNKIKSASGGKKVISALLVLVICVVALVSIKPAKADEAWDLTGTYTIDFVCTSGCSGTYTHQMNVSGMDLVTGDFSGTGKYYTGTPTWTHTGNVSGSNVGFQLVYDGSAYYVDVVGTIASDGSMSGTAGNASQAFDWSTTTGMATFNRHAEITAPSAGDVNTVSVDFEAYLVDDDQDSVQWAVRQGTCDAGTNTVFGNVDGFSDSYGWVYNSGNYLHTFTATADTSAWSLGMYCFVFNPAEDSGESEIRLTRQFQLIDDTAPLVTIDSPIHGAYVSGTVGITATIVEDRELSHYNISVYPGGADYMDFSLRLEGETKYVSSGFGNNGIYDWDTTSYDDGEYLIRLAARDAAGNRDLSVDAWTGGDDSQHVVTVYVDNDGDGVFGEADFCPGTEELDDYQLFPNRWRESESGGKRQVSQVGESDVFTTTDTHGCSCEQINDLLVGKSFIQDSNRYHGCGKSTYENFVADLNDGVLDGYSFVETVQVPATTVAGIDTVSSLVNGQEYLLKASGTYTFVNWGVYGIADAEWAYRNDSYALPVSPHNWTLGEGSYNTDYGLDVLVDSTNVYWGDYNDGHEYEIPFVGKGSTAHFNIYDSAYGDNSGFITVDVFVKLW